MSLSRALLALVLSAAISLALSVGIGAMASDPDVPPQVASVVWNERPETVEELAEAATVLVEARVTAIEDGPELLSPHPDLPADEPGILTQRIVFEAVEVLDGQIPATFKLFKTGSPELYLQGDPLYAVGESYVLFLEPQGEAGTWIPAAPDGRLELDAQGEADPVISGPVSDDLEGMTPEEIEQEASP
jgi:hypothetical protein